MTAHIAANPQWFLKALRADDALQAHRENRIAIYYLFQNSTQFGRDLDRVDAFYARGVRSAQITYNDQNWAGSGCWEPNDGGLSLFGHALVERMNTIGMLIDVSHAGMRTMADYRSGVRRSHHQLACLLPLGASPYPQHDR